MMTVGGPKAQWLSKNHPILPRITNQPKNKRINFFERRKNTARIGTVWPEIGQVPEGGSVSRSNVKIASASARFEGLVLGEVAAGHRPALRPK